MLFKNILRILAQFTSRLLFDRVPPASLALGTNSSAMSVIGNDYGYQQVFARKLKIIAKLQDVFIGISNNENSLNILLAVQVAKDLALVQMGWAGRRDVQLTGICECLKVPSQDTVSIQECHILLGHVLCECVGNNFFEKHN